MTTATLTSDLNQAGRRRLLGQVGEPLLLAAWERSAVYAKAIWPGVCVKVSFRSPPGLPGEYQ